MTLPGNWHDLAPRLLSGAAIGVAGLGLIWAGGVWFQALAVTVVGLMIWELAGITSADGRKDRAIVLGLLAAVTLGFVLWMHRPYWLALLALPSLAGQIGPRRDRVVFALYALGLMFTGYGLVAFRAGHGLSFVLWLVLLVAVADMMGYFGGRLIGGPKFWPAVSPKKTWSGTLSGWVGAAAVGLVTQYLAGAPASLPLFSVAVAFASQMGDIAESAIKRRGNVKDSSNLIPGHGGLMDRFDALAGAVVFILLWGAILPVPQIGD